MAPSMEDEYSGDLARAEKVEIGTFTLESGLWLPSCTIAYNTWGKLNASKNNCVFIGHALTGSADVAQWWGGVLGPGKAIDTNKYFVVSANMLGSCYGTTGPTDDMPLAPGTAPLPKVEKKNAASDESVSSSSSNPNDGASSLGGGVGAVGAGPRRYALPWVAPRNGTHCEAAADRYAADFPYCTLRDTVRLHRMLLEHLGVQSVHAVVGGSAGGMQALEWGIMYPGLVQRVVVIACGATQSAWQVAISEAQRQAVYRDPDWNQGYYALDKPPSQGLAVARQEAMIWYRSHEAYNEKFGRRFQPESRSSSSSSNNNGFAKAATVNAATAAAAAAAKEGGGRGGGGETKDGSSNGHAPVVGVPPSTPSIAAAARQISPLSPGPLSPGAPKTGFSVEGYLDYQGEKFVGRFDANSYVTLTRMLDSHDVGRERGGVEAALASMSQPVLVVGITSDVLYPLDMQRELVALMPNATLRIVDSPEGHDAFLLETPTISKFLTEHLATDVTVDLTDGNGGVSELAVAANPQRMLASPHAMREALIAAKAAGAAASVADGSTSARGQAMSGIAW